MRKNVFVVNNLIAHRGVHYKYLENTIPSFLEAIKKQYIIELDIQLTKDEEIIVFHDTNLKRIFGIDRDISDLTLKEIKKYKYIPTLKESLNIINGRVPIIIDIKSNKKDCRKICKILDCYDGKFAIQSFNPLVILWFKRYKPKYIRGYLIYKFLYLKYILYILNPDYIATNLTNLKKLNKYRKKYILIGYTIKNKKEYHVYKTYADNFICDIQR